MTARKTSAELRREALQGARHAADLRLIAEGLIKRAAELQQQSDTLRLRLERPKKT